MSGNKKNTPIKIKSTIVLIKELTGYSDSYISLVLAGERNNNKITAIANDINSLQNIIVEKYKTDIGN